MSAISDAARVIANLAAMVVEYKGVSREVALTEAATHYVQNARDCRARRGVYSQEITTERMDDHLFHGSVASDILDGTVTRPSVGNVREYALSLV